MPRLMTATVLACLLAGAFGSTALAARPDTFSCPNQNSGWLLVNKDGWWARSVVGFGIAGIPVYEADGQTFTAAFDDFAVSVGFDDGQALKDFIFGDQWALFDVNGNGFVCMRDIPINPQNPGYFFGGIDDRVAVR